MVTASRANLLGVALTASQGSVTRKEVELRPIFRIGKVIWSVPAADGGHCVGINFQKYLTYKDLLFFANL